MKKPIHSPFDLTVKREVWTKQQRSHMNAFAVTKDTSPKALHFYSKAGPRSKNDNP